MDKLLKVKDLCRGNILKGISFEMDKGEMAAIMGPSGSGKSTLLYNISGMDKPDSGEVWLRETEITSLNEEEKADLRLRRTGFVFQQMNALSNLNLIDNIVLPAVHAERNKRNEHYKKAEALMEQLHIGELGQRMVNEVSGGQLQRACICRGMIMDPEILFADEPTGALNQAAAKEVMDAFLKLNSEGTSVLMVTHDLKTAALSERILYILDGELKGELMLGRYGSGSNTEREKKTSEWLAKMGW